MSLLRFLWRWLVRLTAAAFLIGVGVIAFHWAKYRPRCVIVTDAQAIHFSDDGNTLITGFTGTQIGNNRQGGEGKPPIKVWDTRSGLVIRSLLNDVEAFKRYELCPARNLVAADLGNGTIRFADWQTGDEWNIDVGPTAVEELRCSPRGDLLFVRAKQPPQRDLMIDLSTRTIAHQFEPGSRGAYFSDDGAAWHFVRKERLHEWNTTTHKVQRERPEGRFGAGERWFVCRNSEESGVLIYDAASMAPMSRIQPVTPLNKSQMETLEPVMRAQILSNRDYSFSPNGRTIATYAHPNGCDGALEIWETATGKRMALFPALKRGWAWFVSDDTLIFFDRSHIPTHGIQNVDPLEAKAALIDILANSVRWQRPAPLGRFIPLANDTAVILTREGAWEVLDLPSGETRRALPHPFAANQFMVSFSADKSLAWAYGRRRTPSIPEWVPKWITRWMYEHSGAVQILDTRTERIIFGMNTPTGAGAVVSNDCRTFVSFDTSMDLKTGAGTPDQSVYHHRFYDLQTKTPWIWALAVPGGIVALALLWRRWRSSRAHRASAAMPTPAGG